MTALAKVLVVDDDPAVRKSFDRVLSNKGYAVITAESGEEALKKLNEEKYDLVYSDIRMPGISGLEVAETVKASRPWTPVVIITGFGSDAAEARAKAAGVSGFLHKPLSPEMIEGSARDVLAAATEPVAKVEAAPVEEAPAGNRLVNLALFFVAPFVGLAYMIALPFYGFGVLAMVAGGLAMKNPRIKAAVTVIRHVAMVAAAPVVGLAYIVLFPFIGLALLFWMAGKAATAKA